MKDAAFSDGIFSNIVVLRNQAPHSDRQNIFRLCPFSSCVLCLLSFVSSLSALLAVFLSVALLDNRRTAGHALFKACAENIRFQQRLCRQNSFAEILAEK